jgi:hypothetical protein
MRQLVIDPTEDNAEWHLTQCGKTGRKGKHKGLSAS